MYKTHRLLLILTLLLTSVLVLLLSAARTSHATTVLWDESVDGDASHLWNQTALVLVLGENQIVGTEIITINGFPTVDDDRYQLTLPVGLKIVGIEAEILDGAGNANSRWKLLDISTANEFGSWNLHTDLQVTDVTLPSFPLTDSVYNLGSLGGSVDRRTLFHFLDYRWSIQVASPVLNISIDVKPGSDPNCFNVNGHGVIPVAILGSSTFDVTLVDTSTLLFGGLEVRVRGNKGPLCSFEDSNGDTILDLVCHFEDDSTNWAPGDGEATLLGTLLDSTEFEGTDSICVVP